MALSDVLLNDEKLQAEIDAIVDRIQKAFDVELHQVNDMLGGQLTSALTQLGNVASGVGINLQNVIDRLDGWTVTIKLNKPVR
jgi:hypothetical protein